MIAQLGLVLVGLTIFSGVALADATTPSKKDKSAIEKIVREYILENPEVIEEAIQILRARRQAEEENRAKQALSQNGDALRHNPMTPVSGNVDGDVTVVEFFDYQCGYCK
ncbi:MAG: DsbA family protein, partial [Pseudomonadota bacterium]|nr:DsbA family protein [Pseudomonadota bacterium]